MHIRIPAVNGNVVVFQSGFSHIAVIAVSVVGSTQIDDCPDPGITYLCQQPVIATPGHGTPAHTLVIDRG